MRPASPCRWSPSGSRPVLSSSSNRGALQSILPASFSDRTKPPSTLNLTFSNQEWFLPRGATHRGSLTLAAASKPQRSPWLGGPGCPGWGLTGARKGPHLSHHVPHPPTHTHIHTASYFALWHLVWTAYSCRVRLPLSLSHHQSLSPPGFWLLVGTQAHPLPDQGSPMVLQSCVQPPGGESSC